MSISGVLPDKAVHALARVEHPEWAYPTVSHLVPLDEILCVVGEIVEVKGNNINGINRKLRHLDRVLVITLGLRNEAACHGHATPMLGPSPVLNGCIEDPHARIPGLIYLRQPF